MKVNVIHPKCYGADGKVFSTGVQTIDDKVGKNLINRGLAKEVESKSKHKDK